MKRTLLIVALLVWGCQNNNPSAPTPVADGTLPQNVPMQDNTTTPSNVPADPVSAIIEGPGIEAWQPGRVTARVSNRGGRAGDVSLSVYKYITAGGTQQMLVATDRKPVAPNGKANFKAAWKPECGTTYQADIHWGEAPIQIHFEDLNMVRGVARGSVTFRSDDCRIPTPPECEGAGCDPPVCDEGALWLQAERECEHGIWFVDTVDCTFVCAPPICQPTSTPEGNCKWNQDKCEWECEKKKDKCEDDDSSDDDSCDDDSSDDNSS